MTLRSSTTVPTTSSTVRKKSSVPTAGWGLSIRSSSSPLTKAVPSTPFLDGTVSTASPSAESSSPSASSRVAAPPSLGRTFSAASPTCVAWCWNTVTTPWCPSATRSNTCISPSASSPAVQAGPRWHHSSRRFSPTPRARAAASAAGEAPAVRSPRRHAHRQQCSVAATEAQPTKSPTRKNA